MFFSQHILTRKGPLGNVWIAATLGERSVTKRYATKVEIVGLCMSINTPTAPFALRLSAQLMLGVARVFARKSDIVLGDSNALLHALQKFSSAPLGTDGSARGGRGRIQGSITLGDADPNAFNKITLPAKRSGSKRKRTTGDDDTEEEPSSQGNTKGVTSLAVALQGDPSAIDLPALTPWMDSQFQFDFDVDAAMEMAFPSISMPASGKISKGVGPESNGLYDGSNGHLSSSGKISGSKSTYRARAEDITIAQELNRLSNSDLMISSAVDTGMMNYSMLVDHDRLDASHGGSHGGNGSSNNYMMESPHGPQVDDLLPNYNVFGLSKFAKSTGKAGDGVKRVSDSGDAGSGAVGTPTFLPRDVKEYGNFTSQRATKTGEGACPRSGDFAALGRISPGTPVQDIADVEGELRAASRDVKRSSGARPPRAPKRFLKMQFDEVTELSTSQIRDNLNDVARTLGGRATTETSTTPKKRRVGPSRSVIEEAMVSNPLMGYMMASQLKAVWEQLVAGPELDAMRRRRQAEKEQNDRQCTPQRDDPTKSDTHVENISVLATPLPQGHTPLHQDASYAPIFADTPDIGATGMVNSDTPDFAAFRDEGPVTGDPSTAPQPASVDMTALEPEKLRDQVLDNITEADRAAFEVARRLTFDGNDPEGHAPGGTSKQGSKAASLQSRLSRDSGPMSVPASVGRALFNYDTDQHNTSVSNDDKLPSPVPMRDSMFQLEEQTEPQPVNDASDAGIAAAHLSPMAAIEIRTFKMLALVREQAKEAAKGASEEDLEDKRVLTTFDRIAVGCSRSTAAKMFYHVVALTTTKFLRVAQDKPYGQIALHKGDFF